MIVTLKKTIPSIAHNSPCNEERGHHWPEGQRFKRVKSHRFGKSAFEQIGGEEVLLLVPDKMVAELFGEGAV